MHFVILPQRNSPATTISDFVQYSFGYYLQLFRSFARRWTSVNSPTFIPRLSLFLCMILAGTGVALGTAEESLSIATNGLIALVDVLNSMLFIAAVDRAVRDADATFNYGYGKYESLAMLSSASLLTFVSLYILVNVFMSFGTAAVNQRSWVLVGFSLSSFGAMYGMSYITRRYARKYQYQMLHYDAALWRLDSFMELGVAANILTGVALTHFGHGQLARVLDSATALTLIALAFRIPLKHGRSALNQLLDRTLDEDIQLKLLGVIAERLDNFCEYRSIRSRQSGRDMFIELDVVMPFDYTLEQAYVLERNLEIPLKELYPSSIFKMYVTPCPRDCYRNGVCYCPVKQNEEAKRGG